MGEKDIVERQLEDHADVFADIVNVLLFQGEQRVRPEELMETGMRSQYKADTGTHHEQERDVGKYWVRDGRTRAMFGLENQTDREPDMPLRVAGYEGANYRSQLLKGADGQKYPVVTLILYYGKKRWRSGRSLCARVSVPEELRHYVNEHRINLYEISHLTEEQLEQFQSDFGAVAEYFVRSKDTPEYLPSPRPIRHVDEFLKMMSVFTGDRRYEEMIEEFNGKEEVTMCDVLDYRERIGQEKGERIGREQGERIGREQGERIGRRAGEDSMRKLFSRLLKEKKMDEFNRALEDAAFCEQLLKGYGLG